MEPVAAGALFAFPKIPPVELASLFAAVPKMEGVLPDEVPAALEPKLKDMAR
jgi:hypothetical protein